MQEKIQAVRAKVTECIALAEKTYGIEMPALAVRFDLRGNAAGVAGCKQSWLGGASDFFLRFNTQHMALGGQSWKHIIEDVVSHEVAHTVCQAFPQLGKNHDKGWKRVCITLGGNGKRCYSTAQAPEAVAKNKPYVYTTNKGNEVRVSKIIHTKIQRGAGYNYRNGIGSIGRESVFEYCTKAVELKRNVAPIQPLTITKKVHIPTAPKARNGMKSNAHYIREQIALGKSFNDCVKFGITVLGMKKALAKTYVKNNWK